ncbi:MAG: hypothetical protein NV1_33 [Nanoarchaeotal virus 1]|nr:MAG: hypothetical protein NV1_33 [Nanoarchaeotal virus 1]
MRRRIILDVKGSEIFREDLKELLELLQIHIYVPIDNIKTIIEEDYSRQGEYLIYKRDDETITRRSILHHYKNAKEALYRAADILSMMSQKAYYRANNEAYQLISKMFWDIKKIDEDLWYGINLFKHYPDDPASIDELHEVTVKSLEMLNEMIDNLVNAMDRGVFV